MREYQTRALLPNDLFALQYVHDARLSPDGRRIAYVVSRTAEESAEEFFDIAIAELAGGAHAELGFKGRATFPRWSPDGAQLAFIGVAGQSSRLYLADAQARHVRALSAPDSQVQGPPSWSADGSAVAYTVATIRKQEGIRRITRRIFRSEGLGVIDNLALGIEIADVSSGAARRLELKREVALKPLFSPCGKWLLFMGSETAMGYAAFGGLKLLTVELANGQVAEVLGEGWSIAAAAWAPGGERIVIAGDHDSSLTVPTMGLWVVNRDGSNPQCRTEGFVGNVGQRAHHDMPTWNTLQDCTMAVPDNRYAYASVTKHGCGEIWRIALDGVLECRPVVAGERTCVILDASAKHSRLLYCASDLRTPWNLYAADLQGGQEQRLTRLNDAVLAKWPAMKIEHLQFTSADGLPLEGWYMARADRNGPQPTVMFIHGGPFLSTGHAFRYDFHLLAANGYAVLFANFRGSAGYGEPFVQGIVGDWGANGFPDHMATVDAALARGLADPKRLGVWGHSHGGFATCWAVGHTNRFAAAVADASVTNFSTLYYICDAPDVFVKDLGGKPHEIPDVYRSRSPLTYAWRCRTPTLMLHGVEDLRCPLAEAEQFYRALHDAGCTTEMVQIPHADHMGDSTGPLPARRAQNEALLDWFERFL